MDEHKTFEGNNPTSCFFHSGGEAPRKRLKVDRRGSYPFKDAAGIVVVDFGTVVARGSNDSGLEVGMTVWGAARKADQPNAISVFDCSSSLSP